MPRKVDVFLLPCIPTIFFYFSTAFYIWKSNFLKKVQLWEWVNWIQILDPHFASSLSKRPLVIRTAHLCRTVPDDEKSVVKKIKFSQIYSEAPINDFKKLGHIPYLVIAIAWCATTFLCKISIIFYSLLNPYFPPGSGFKSRPKYGSGFTSDL